MKINPEQATGEIATRRLHEDASCRVWELRLGAGEATDWHVHKNPYRFVVTSEPGLVQTEYGDGRVEVQDHDPTGHSDKRAPDPLMPERLVNMGHTLYTNIVIEFLREPS